MITIMKKTFKLMITNIFTTMLTPIFTKDGLYQVLVNNTILNTILDKMMQNYTILYTNTIPTQNN